MSNALLLDMLWDAKWNLVVYERKLDIDQANREYNEAMIELYKLKIATIKLLLSF